MKKLAELTYVQVGKETRDSTLLLLPVGSIEEHGPHMALMTDCVAAEQLSLHAGPHLEKEGYNVLIAPTVPFGITQRAMDYPGNITVAPDTLKALVKDICRSLSYHGFQTIVIVNGHMGQEHVETLERAKEELREEVPARIFLFGFCGNGETVAAIMAKGVRELLQSAEPKKESHAGESETSMVLYARPDLVDGKVLETLPTGTNYDSEEYHSGTKPFKQVSEGGLGYFGSPSLATPELGEKILAIRGKNLAGEILKALRASQG